MSTAELQFDRLRNLLNLYDIKLSQPIDRDLLCTFCQKLSIDIWSASCGCKFCENCSRNYLNCSKKVCPNFSNNNSTHSITEINSFQIESSIILRILEIEVFCPNFQCTYHCKLKFLENHIDYCDKKADNTQQHQESQHHHLISGLKNINFTDNTANQVLETLQKKISQLCEIEKQHKIEIDLLKNNLKSQDQKMQILHNETIENQAYIQSLNQNVNYLLEENENLKKLFNDQLYHPFIINSSFDIVKTKPFIWKITHFSQRQLQADTENSIFSDPFYSHENGYKLCLGINPIGIQQYQGKYLFVFFCIMKGHYDDNLHWPMKLEIVLSIVDQITLKDYKTFKFRYATITEMLQHSFSKPNSEKNDGIGDNEFISFKELNSNNNILKNDSILLRCSINS